MQDPCNSPTTDSQQHKEPESLGYQILKRVMILGVQKLATYTCAFRMKIDKFEKGVYTTLFLPSESQYVCNIFWFSDLNRNSPLNIQHLGLLCLLPFLFVLVSFSYYILLDCFIFVFSCISLVGYNLLYACRCLPSGNRNQQEQERRKCLSSLPGSSNPQRFTASGIQCLG